MQIDCDFLFLSEGELSFLLVSLKNLLEEKGYKTDKNEMVYKKLTGLECLPKIFVLDAEVFNRNTEAREYIIDLCIEQGVKIVLIGDQNDIDAATKITLANVIIGTFARPINNNEVAVKLEYFIEAANLKEDQKRILVIDDSPTFLRLISDWLEVDFAVNVCPSATAAFRMIESNKPDLILLDYEMPICNGAMFLEMLHSEPAFAGIPVIFLTSKDDMETVREVLALKPQGYLLKTQTKEAIIKSINGFFAGEKQK